MPSKSAATAVALNGADAIKKSLGLESCSSTTVSLLQQSLFGPPSSLQASGTVSAKARTTKPTIARKKVTAEKTTVAAGLVPSTAERYRLAIETINACVTALGDAVRNSPAAGTATGEAAQATSEPLPKETVRQKKAGKLASTSTRPLQARSLNRNDSPSAPKSTPLDHLAACCNLAISFVRSIQYDRAPGVPEVPPLQAENAHYTLIIRLMHLGMYETALKGLGQLKKGLELAMRNSGAKESWVVEDREEKQVFAKARGKPLGKTATAGKEDKQDDSSQLETECIAKLLDFAEVSPTSTAFSLVLPHQIAVLRCIACLKRPELLEAILPSLSASSNPISLLKIQSKTSPSKALSQISSLVHSISVWIPSSSTSTDAVAMDPKRSPSPRSVLALQLLLMECTSLKKCIQPDDAKGKDQWQLFANYLAAYIRRSAAQKSKRDRYVCVQESAERARLLLNGRDSAQPLPLDVYKLLSWTAADATLAKECVKWTEEWLRALEANNDRTNDALIVLCEVRLAVIELKGTVPRQPGNISSEPEAVNKLEERVRDAVDGLTAVVKGRKQDFDFLLQEVGALRRASLGLLALLLRELNIDSESGRVEDAKATDTKRKLKKICDAITRSIISFCKKYIAMESSEEDKARLRAILVPTIDTALSTCWRGFDVDSSQAWDDIEALLRECGSAVKALEAKGVGGVDPTYYERVSNAHWQVHLLYRRKPGAEPESVRALRKSIGALDGRPVPELGRANIALKWERLGSIFVVARDYKKSEDSFLDAMRTFAMTGVLERLGKRASGGESVSRIIADPDRDVASISRALASLVKIAQKKKDGIAAELRFDYEGLSNATRGFVLEWAFRTALGVMGNDGSIVRIIGERLLDVYRIEEMPIRRGRIVSTLLGLTVDRAGVINKDEVIELGVEITDWANDITPLYLAYDCELDKYKDDVVANCLLSLAFCHWQEDSPSPDLIRKALATWNRVIESSSDWGSILQQIENVEELFKRLNMIVDFCEMKGEVELRVAALRTLIALRGLEQPVNYDAVVALHSALGQQYIRLGYSGKAGIFLAKAQVLLKKAPQNITTATQLQWHLAYTEYLVIIGNVEKSSEYIRVASELVESDEELSQAKQSGARVSKRAVINRTVADAAYITSLLSFEKGNVNEALMNARRSIRLNQRAWAGLESISKDIPESGFSKQEKQVGAPEEGLTEGMGALSLSLAPKPKVHPTTYGTLNLPNLWPLVTSLYLSLVQAASVYRHLGMLREAMFFTEQALKIAEAVEASTAMARTKVMIGDLKIRSGQIEPGEKMLEEAGKFVGQGPESIEYELAMANLERAAGEFDAEREAYDRAERRIEELIDVQSIERFGSVGDVGEDLADQMAHMDLKESRRRSRPKTPEKKKGTTAALKAAVSKIGPIKSSPKSAVAGECSALLRQKRHIQRLKAYSLAISDRCAEAEELLALSSKSTLGHQEAVSQGLVEAKQLLHEALSMVSSDPVFSVLQDSTLSLPSIALTSPTEIESKTSPVKKASRKATASAKQTKAFIEVLERARDCVCRIHSRAVKMGSATMANNIASLLAGIVVILSAMSNTKGRGHEHPLFATYSLELNKGLHMRREKLAVETEKLAAGAKEDLSWPEIDDSRTKVLNFDSTSLDFASFQKEYIDIIPKQWVAVSISLNENRDELYVSRFRAGENQLMVRLPLTRHNSRDDYQDIFEFDTGLDELREIITEANTSTHDAKNMTTKETRAKWWAKREALDNRLKELLLNIEHVWLGGFKGILCQYSRNLSLFARFKASFEKIMAKHLPSRRKKKKGKVDIDYSVLELFVALGNPEGQELDEALMDLIYFVIDILQFHGEGNAYDEIDTDAMVVELTDVLTSYHEEAGFHPEEAESDIDHTILILDKSVQMFPWESLPCLRGNSVSRLPSLAALRERILQMQQVRSSQPRPGYYVSRDSGAYVLNPDSDLKNTQKTFEADLKSLTGDWDRIVNRAPSEGDFAAALEQKDVFLYFGHGSGAHYISAKKIRRMEKCAVSCLMGCSSGVLKDNGEFDPYGTPTNYLLAGCPAILATLWDVTDKDIDRFSKDVFDKWGLLEKDGGLSKGSVRGKSLVEAVAGARDKCVMAYLNGAAPVVYGIPVYFA